jgi:hypothetical protein
VENYRKSVAALQELSSKTPSHAEIREMLAEASKNGFAQKSKDLSLRRELRRSSQIRAQDCFNPGNVGSPKYSTP